MHVIVKSDENARLEFDGVTVHRVVPVWDSRMVLDRVDGLVPRALYSPYQDIKAAWCLWRRWARIRREAPFDVVQIANVLAVGLFFRFERHVPVVARMSSYRPLWDTQAGTPDTVARRARWFLERVSVQGARHVIAPTRFVANLVERHYKRNVEVIETPFCLARTADVSPPVKGFEDGFGLFFGRATQMKGAHILADALPAVLEKIPGFKFIFVGGDGPAPGGGSMKEYVRAKTGDYSERIRILDPVRHDALYPMIERARLVVIPSVCDNMPNTLLEALGHGKLVIATHGTCFEDMIEDGVSGVLVEAGNVGELSDAIVAAWEFDEARRAEMSANALASVERVAPEHVIPKLERYYRKAMRA